MRQQRAIVAASGPRTPINGRTSNRIGIPRNGGDSGIFTAVGRLYPMSSDDCQAADTGQNQKCSSAQCGTSSPFRPLTTAPCAVPAGGGPQALWTIPHQNTQSHGGTDGCAFGRWRRHTIGGPHLVAQRALTARRRKSGQGLCGGVPRITRCRMKPLYPKPRSAAMAKPCRNQAPSGLAGTYPHPIGQSEQQELRSGS
jgi:hypothetical protein